ncbi:MAG TPA: hypothetical protein VLX61_01380 [Anaerolineales bacterium]|nr:hypothetical protein [Anaerolineales bacterium]
MKSNIQKPDVETLTVAQRGAELLVVVAMVLLFSFFADHQLTHTGFLSTKFGVVEMFCLYGPIPVSLVAPLVKVFTGRRNPARPFEAATNLSLAIGSFWLRIVFPFNFAHLADVLPGALRFAISWITNDIGKILLMLPVIVGPIVALLVTLKYFSIRRQTSAA